MQHEVVLELPINKLKVKLSYEAIIITTMVRDEPYSNLACGSAFKGSTAG